jgi:hypothetical protein
MDKKLSYILYAEPFFAEENKQLIPELVMKAIQDDDPMLIKALGMLFHPHDKRGSRPQSSYWKPGMYYNILYKAYMRISDWDSEFEKNVILKQLLGIMPYEKYTQKQFKADLGSRD